ncbi:MAG: type II secretion system protein [Desulfobacterales bacterium]|nr:type II secretion system protein [Desulfobacterales bacterium]
MNPTRDQRGFVLIELITVIVLIGMIAAFTTFFLYTGFKGYEDTKTRNEGALSAQMALDRITLELRDINSIVPTPSGTSVIYKSAALSGTRTLKYVGVNILINIDPPGGVAGDYMLLEDISAFNLSYTYQNLDHDTVPVDEVARIDVEFNLSGIEKKFGAKIFPRNMVPKTW